MGVLVTDAWCEECFIGWREGERTCWQCGHAVSISKEQGQVILAQADLLDRVATWARRTRRW